MLRLVVVALALAPSAGCADPPPDGVWCEGAHERPLFLEVGQGFAESERMDPLPADGTMPLFEGPQGPQKGYHVWTQFRVQGVCPSSTTVSWVLREEHGGRVMFRTDSRLPLIEAEGETWCLPIGNATQVCPYRDGTPVAERDLSLEVQLHEGADREGREPEDGFREASAILTIHPVCADQECLEVCGVHSP